MTQRDRQIFEYWAQQAETHGEAPEASWSDRRVIELEIAAIRSRIPRGARVLDVGCANGFSSVRYADVEGVTLLGLDYVPAMVDAANRRRAGLPPELAERVEFRIGDARSLDLPAGAFECVISTRVIINLGDWEAQQGALRELSRVLGSGGTLLLSEATVSGWTRLNKLREEYGLPAIPMPDFNTYLHEDRLIAFLDEEIELVEAADFASSYYLATRLVKPLLASVAGRSDDYVFDPQAEFNRLAALLPPVGDYGVQKLFALRKR